SGGLAVASAAPNPVSPVGHVLRVAFAATLCLVLAEWCHLANSNLAVWTSYLVMAQYPFTIFQKGFERILGRGAGILAGLLLATWFRNTEPVALLLTAVVLTFCFYIYFAGRLAYTFLNAGLFCMIIEHLGRADPLSAGKVSKELFVAIVFGVV